MAEGVKGGGGEGDGVEEEAVDCEGSGSSRVVRPLLVLTIIEGVRSSKVLCWF